MGKNKSISKKSLKDVSIGAIERLRKNQLMRAMISVRRELFKRKIDMRGIKQQEAVRIYAKEVFGEEFLFFKTWIYNKIDSGYFEDCIINEKTLKLPPKKRRKKVKKQTYEEFLKSPYWRKIRILILKRDNNSCRSCGSSEELHIHHLTYEHHLKELDNLDDLITLCKQCHNDIHGRVNGKNTIPLGKYESIYN